MEQKLRAAAGARRSKDTFLIARTDARAVHGLDEALRRAERYVKAGADGIFVEAPLTVEELARIGREVEVPQFCNMLTGGRTPILTNKELYEMGFEMVVHGITLVMKVAKTMRDALEALKQDKLSFQDDSVTFEEFKKIMNFGQWAEIEDKFGR
jgi:2-methylisocitrate lyase-like PEP mutase family enzyme